MGQSDAGSVRERRQALGLTRKDLALRAGIKKSLVESAERPNSGIGKGALKRINDALDGETTPVELDFPFANEQEANAMKEIWNAHWSPERERLGPCETRSLIRESNATRSENDEEAG